MDKMNFIAGTLVLAGLLLLAALPAPASAGLAGFQYQREITIQENSGETLRDYQVLVELAGDDFPEEAQPDGDDIRFTDADGRELSYWIEVFDAGSKRAAIWVKVPLIPANGEARITMWYGNPGAESKGDGEAVFEFFDDFEGSGLDTRKWAQQNSAGGSLSIGGSTITFTNSGTGNYVWIHSLNTFAYPRWVEAKATKFNPGGVTVRMGESTGTTLNANWFYNYYNEYSVDVYRSNYRIVGDSSASGWAVSQIPTSDTSGILSFVWSATGAQRFDVNYVNKLTGADTTNAISNYYFYLGVAKSFAGDAQIDWVRVRKYSASEPTITLAPPAPATHTALSITKSPSPHSIRQFGETTITIAIENSCTTDATDIEITDTIHPSFDLTSGDFPNPKRYDLIRPGETRDLQYTIRAMESGTFTLDPANVTYADEDGNIQEAKSEPVSIKVIPSTEGSTAGGAPRNPSVSTASVQLHGEKTNVVLGEDILLKLSAVNLITKPTMHVQVIIIPPSGMSVTSSAFAKSGAGQYTTTYELEPGSGKDIEVAIRSNQVGDFDVNGRIIYYFGDDREDSEDHTLTLPITVRAEAEPVPDQTAGTSESEGSSTPGFAAVVAITGLLAAYLRRKI
ncbi:hypothetical protein DRO03_10710 [Methanosarcinales archaeon]|nr:MAG: hypothetical protein DRO03_10710 [Methanosarcinales archaeon]